MNFPGVIQRVVHIGGGQIKRQCVDCPGQFSGRFFEGIRQAHLARGISMSNSKSRGSTSALKRTVNLGRGGLGKEIHPPIQTKITPPFQARTCQGFRISLGFSIDSDCSKKTRFFQHPLRLEKISFPCPSDARLLADALACMGIRRKALLQPGRPPHPFRKLLLLSWGRREQAQGRPTTRRSSGCSPK